MLRMILAKAVLSDNGIVYEYVNAKKEVIYPDLSIECRGLAPGNYLLYV